MKKKILKIGIWGLVTVFSLSLAWYVFMADALVVFDLPDKKVISYKCDHEGLRQVAMHRLEGNAVTNPSIHVSIHLGCDNYEKRDEKIIFTADNSSIEDSDVKINLVTFDTLRVEYKKGLRIFTKLDRVAFADSTLNLNVTYKEWE
jgi:hypothetical protein